MDLGLILKIYFVWFIFLAPIAFVCINLSIGIWRVLKSTWKNPERELALETKSQMKVFLWKPELDGSPERRKARQSAHMDFLLD